MLASEPSPDSHRHKTEPQCCGFWCLLATQPWPGASWGPSKEATTLPGFWQAILGWSLPNNYHPPVMAALWVSEEHGRKGPAPAPSWSHRAATCNTQADGPSLAAAAARTPPALHLLFTNFFVTAFGFRHLLPAPRATSWIWRLAVHL